MAELEYKLNLDDTILFVLKDKKTGLIKAYAPYEIRQKDSVLCAENFDHLFTIQSAVVLKNYINSKQENGESVVQFLERGF